MGLNATPSAERVHIGIFGKRNAGKSSIINAVTGQSLTIVSEVRGTTTDPVSKAMELLPLGPVVMIDTPGLDDSGELGALRVKKSYQVLNKTDIAVIVADGTEGFGPEEEALRRRIQEKKIPYVIVINKADQMAAGREEEIRRQLEQEKNLIFVSAEEGTGIHALKEMIAAQAPEEDTSRHIVGDLVAPEDLVVIVIPIDKAAPKGRLILPEQQTIRDLLDTGAVSVVTRETELEKTLASLGKPPALVVTDSQAFGIVSRITPREIPLTSFSILFARYKGNLKTLVRGVTRLDQLKDGDPVLISEGCTHHRQCNDIGTVKLPGWIEAYTGVKPEYTFSSGTGFPDDLSPYRLIIHCGGCMLNEREVKYRIQCAEDQQVPITNYGVSIAYMHGILERSLEPFADIAEILKKE
ncbi:MAG: [FeFe] hydrogenase H-cluster maturation GTPase HydF [Lachnospiraceae bacterium]|jgi:[FeFe] hydrogenase H-cluster maturation GTPase HydF|nr:[FeFe] hydrogenase H-cluster maturation GTPase HydF [Lachnospiraceae bacterium]MCI1656427.1 [FeFe] hydrogenase H-cluster maturation GTPase HydF [Lachnospiraceae bacterium]MCI2194909.1 [FeFe] hydrogenase H-cluster maturation GTPase HydF [Lachnospiraceae bacterium]